LRGLDTDHGLPIPVYVALGNMAVELLGEKMASELHEAVRYNDDWAYVISRANLEEILN